jgi:hypothetical protein
MSSRRPGDEEGGSERRANGDWRSIELGVASSLTPRVAGEPERRDHRRHAVANLRVKSPIVGDVINTCHLGIAIQTNESLTVGWSYAFRMRNGSEMIRIPGKVKWCRLVQLLRIGEDEFLPVFRMGVQMAGNLWGKPQVYYYP